MHTPQGQTPPNPPTTPPPGAGTPVGTGLGQIIQNAVGEGLASAQVALEQQLTSAIASRDAIQHQLDLSTSTRERATLTRQLTTANKKIRDLQTGIEKLKAGQDKVTGPSFPGETRPPLQNINDVVPTTMIVSVMTILFIGFPLSIAFARIMYKRAVHKMSAPQAAPLSADAARRFDHLEQSVDSIAIEIERISEGQRYLTKVLSEPRISASSEPPKPIS